MVRLKVDPEAPGGLRHPPGSFALGPHKGFLHYPGQPIYCRRCGALGHTKVACTGLRCRFCGGEGHVATDCKAPKTCSLCGSEAHLYLKCPNRKGAFATLFTEGLEEMSQVGGPAEDEELLMQEREGEEEDSNVGEEQEETDDRSIIESAEESLDVTEEDLERPICSQTEEGTWAEKVERNRPWEMQRGGQDGVWEEKMEDGDEQPKKGRRRTPSGGMDIEKSQERKRSRKGAGKDTAEEQEEPGGGNPCEKKAENLYASPEEGEEAPDMFEDSMLGGSWETVARRVKAGVGGSKISK